MSYYEGFFVRSFLGDTNKYPKPMDKKVWESPDIIPYGSTTCLNPQDEFIGNNEDKWNKTFGRNVYQGMQNYIYIRGENMIPDKLTGDLYLYSSKSTLLLVPDTWEKIKTNRRRNSITLSSRAKEKMVCSSVSDGNCFVYEPKATNSNDHLCLISRVVSEKYPAPIPVLKDIDDFSVFIRSEKSMGYAQRNLRFFDAKLPEITMKETINNFLYPFNDAYVHILLYNAPIGCEIQMTSPSSRPGCNFEVPRTKIEHSNGDDPLVFAVRLERVPNNFFAEISVYLWTNGSKLPGNFKMNLDLINMSESQSKAYKYGMEINPKHYDLVFENERKLYGDELQKHLSALKPKKSIVVGRCEYVGSTI